MENRDISVHHLTLLPREQIASTEGTTSKLDQHSQTLNANSSQFSFIKKQLASQIYSVFIHRLELVGSNPGTQLKKSLQSEYSSHVSRQIRGWRLTSAMSMWLRGMR